MSNALTLSTALAGVLSGKDGRTLQVKIDAKIGAAFDPATDTMYLPGLPMGELDPEVRDDLLAYLAHESGERGISGWTPTDPRWHDKPGLRHLVNGISDAMIDRAQLERWPGAGMAIRSRVRKDWERVVANGGYPTPIALGNVAHAMRLIGDRIVTPEEIAAVSPAMGETLQKIRPIIDGLDFDSQDACIDAALRIYATLRPDPETTPEPEQAPASDPTDEDESEDGDGDGQGQGERDAPAEPSASAEDGEPGGEDERAEPDTGAETPEPSAQPESTRLDPDAVPPDGDYHTTEQQLAKHLTRALSTDGDTDTYTSHPDLVHRHAIKAIWQRDAAAVTPFLHSKAVPRQHRGPIVDVTARLLRGLRELMRVEDRALVRRQRFGELDMTRLTNAVVRGEEAVMQRRGRDQAESLAVHLCCDLSGSMGFNTLRGEMRLAESFNEALGKLAVPTRVTGWYGYEPIDHWHLGGTVQRHASHLITFKDWGEPWNAPHVAWGFGRARSLGGNCDVDALTDALTALASRPERRKVLLYLTDGQPLMPMVQYQMTAERANALLMSALTALTARADALGITLVVVGIGLVPHAQTTVQNVFGAERVVNLSPNTLAESVTTVFLKTLKGLLQTGKRGKYWRAAA